MKPAIHVTASLSLGILLGVIFKSPLAAALCLVSGVLIDIDHIIDFLIHFGWRKFSFQRCYEACEQTCAGKGDYQFPRLYLVLHSVELAIVLCLSAVIVRHPLLIAVTVGYTSHLVLDQIGNPVRPHFYSMIGRGLHRFSTSRLFIRPGILTKRRDREKD